MNGMSRNCNIFQVFFTRIQLQQPNKQRCCCRHIVDTNYGTLTWPLDVSPALYNICEIRKCALGGVHPDGVYRAKELLGCVLVACAAPGLKNLVFLELKGRIFYLSCRQSDQTFSETISIKKGYLWLGFYGILSNNSILLKGFLVHR